MTARFVFALGLWLSLLGCRSRDSKESTDQSAVPAAPSATDVRPPAATVLQQPLVAEPPAAPTQEDFEDDANREITSKNLEEELDKLERELNRP